MNPDIESSFQTCIRNISLFMAQEAYAKAEQELDAFYETYSGKAEDAAWLENAWHSWKALLYEQQAQYETALIHYESTRYEIHSTEYQSNMSNIIRVKTALKRYPDALQDITLLLEHELHYLVNQGLPILKSYAEILENLPGQPMAEKCTDLVHQVSHLLDIHGFTADTHSAEACIHSIRSMRELFHHSSRKYSVFRKKIVSQELSPAARQEALSEYLNAENIGYYRSLALQKFEATGTTSPENVP